MLEVNFPRRLLIEQERLFRCLFYCSASAHCEPRIALPLEIEFGVCENDVKVKYYESKTSEFCVVTVMNDLWSKYLFEWKGIKRLVLVRLGNA